MRKSRFSQRLRNKLNNSKEFEVPQFPHQQLKPTFLPENHRQVLAQKALEDAKPERPAQKTKHEEDAEEEDSELYGTPDNDTDSATTEKTKTKTKNGQITPAEEKLLKTKFTSKSPALFGSVQNFKEESETYRAYVYKISNSSSQNTTPQSHSL